MAKTFFENFKDAGQIYPGSTWGADSNGNIRLANGGIRNIYLPDAYGDDNSAAWKYRVAVPFKYSIKNNEYSRPIEKHGILYIPSYEAYKIDLNGNIQNDSIKDLDIYGAEIVGTYMGGETVGGQSLSADGFRNLVNNPKNTNFSFDLSTRYADTNPAKEAFRETYGRYPVSDNVSGYEVEGKGKNKIPFISNLRKFMSGWGL